MHVEEVDMALTALAKSELATYRPFARAVRLDAGPRFRQPLAPVLADDPLIEGKREKLQRMVAYAQDGRHCRRATLLRYLGERHLPDCAGCDVCQPDLAVPWANERPADVPNPALLFDAPTVALALIEANVGRAELERRSPLGRQALKCILLGNAYPVLKRETDAYMRKWKDRRLRSFDQWGLLASLPRRGEAIESLFDRLMAQGLVEPADGGGDEDFRYQFLRPTGAGYAAVTNGGIVGEET
jgi:hypothetical protein